MVERKRNLKILEKEQLSLADRLSKHVYRWENKEVSYYLQFYSFLFDIKLPYSYY